MTIDLERVVENVAEAASYIEEARSELREWDVDELGAAIAIKARIEDEAIDGDLDTTLEYAGEWEVLIGEDCGGLEESASIADAARRWMGIANAANCLDEDDVERAIAVFNQINEHEISTAFGAERVIEYAALWKEVVEQTEADTPADLISSNQEWEIIVDRTNAARADDITDRIDALEAALDVFQKSSGQKIEDVRSAKWALEFLLARGAENLKEDKHSEIVIQAIKQVVLALQDAGIIAGAHGTITVPAAGDNEAAEHPNDIPRPASDDNNQPTNN